MSMTDRMNELTEYEEEVVGALQTLDEQEILEGILDHKVGMGIARKIITDGTIRGLSEKQNTVLNERIIPRLKIECEECKRQIDYTGIQEAYEHSFEYGILCDQCREPKMIFKNAMAKS